MDCIYMVLFQSFNYSKCFTTQVSSHPVTHTFTPSQQGGFSIKCQPAHQEFIHTHSQSMELPSGAIQGSVCSLSTLRQADWRRQGLSHQPPENYTTCSISWTTSAKLTCLIAPLHVQYTIPNSHSWNWYAKGHQSFLKRSYFKKFQIIT